MNLIDTTPYNRHWARQDATMIQEILLKRRPLAEAAGIREGDIVARRTRYEGDRGSQCVGVVRFIESHHKSGPKAVVQWHTYGIGRKQASTTLAIRLVETVERVEA